MWLEVAIDIGPVARMGHVPLDGLLESLLERVLLLPAERLNVAAVDLVALVVQDASWHELHPLVVLLGLLDEAHQDLGQVEYGDADGGADVVELIGLTLVQQHVVGLDHVVDVDEVALARAVVVHAALLVVEQARDELGHDLFDELARSVDVVAACDHNGHVEALLIGHDDALGRQLAARVRIGRLKRLVDVLVLAGRAVHLDFDS